MRGSRISVRALQIDDHVADRSCTANEKIAVGRHVEWLWSVDDHPRNQPALATVTHTGPARPADRDCGAGQLARYLATREAADVIGVDVSERMLELAPRCATVGAG